MEVEEKTFERENNVIRVKYNIPSSDTERGILFVPGISSGALGQRFSSVAEKAAEKGFMFMRFESWEGAEDLQEKTLGEVQKDLKFLLKVFRDKGVEKVSVVGKSFGGGVVLTLGLKEFEKAVLWAPAIGVSKEPNIGYWKDRKLGAADTVKDIKIGVKTLEKIGMPVKIIHGTSDEVMDLENSEKMVSNLEDGSLCRIEEAGHSYRDKMEELVDETLDFLIP